MIRVFADLEALSLASAELFAMEAELATSAGSRFSVALSGGHTPIRAFELLSREPFNSSVPWENSYIFWGDERCVPPEDTRNNSLTARKTFLDKVPIPPSQIYPINCSGSADSAALEYEKLLAKFFNGASPVFSMIFLGLGEDGHTASLFPGNPVLEQTGCWVAGVHRGGKEVDRVTLTPLIINQAKRIVFQVSGKNKAVAVKETILGPFDPDRLPAQLISANKEKLIWLLDEEAAALLG